MTRLKVVAILTAATLAVAGCSGDGRGISNQDAGIGIGALAGGLLGSTVGKGGGRVAATIVGAFVGGVVGSEIGRRMDEHDRRLAQQAEYDAFERGNSGRARVWRNERNGNYGEVVPSRPYRRGSVDCRDYTHTVYIDGRPETMRGTACRNPDGTWRSA